MWGNTFASFDIFVINLTLYHFASFEDIEA